VQDNGESALRKSMLQISKTPLAPDQRLASEFVSPAEIYAAIVGFLHRQFPVILIVLLLSLALGAFYLFTATPRFTGHAVLVIDTHKTQVFQVQSPLGDLPIDSSTVDTQIEILKSENIESSVVKDLHLNEDPEFIEPKPGLIDRLIGFITFAFIPTIPTFQKDAGGGPTPEFRRMRSAIWILDRYLTVKRAGLTYAVDIEFKSVNPDRAAQVANAVADAYVVDSLEAKYQTTRRAASWLQDRLKELREESANAERAVVDYKSKNNIVDTGGRLINDQQLAELNSALVQARAMTAESKARLDRVQQIISAGDVDPASSATATVADTLRNEVISKLRTQYLEHDAKASLLAAKLGANHLAVVNLRNQMRELRRTIFEELERTAEGFKSDYEIAKTRQESLQQSVKQMVAESQTTNEAQITLHNLQASAETYRALYDSFLQRYMESVQQQSFPVSEARLITRATPPLAKSSPKTMLILGLAGVAGLILGAAFGFLRDLSDRVFRTTEQIEDRLKADCISVVPLVEDRSKVKEVLLTPLAGSQPADQHVITADQSLLWTVAHSPLSRFAESIRAVKIAIDSNKVVKANKVIGITSSLPNEGKSTIAVALAELIGHGGSRVLLVDGDLRNPSLSRRLAPNAQVGLLEVVRNAAAIEDVLWFDHVTGFEFLPAVLRSRLPHSSEILASQATKTLFASVREIFDYIIVDLSPLAPVVDVRVVTPLVDSFVFVAEWGRTKVDVAELALTSARSVYDNLLGVVLNKADMTVFGRYQSNRGNYYYNRYYAQYGYVE
jgi:succinoglycan biosynthesis transport protein ExoP